MRTATVAALLIALAALGAAAIFLLRAPDDATRARGDETTASRPHAEAPAAPATASAHSSAESRSVADAPATKPSREEPPAADRAATTLAKTRVLGLVLDYDGRPAADAEIRFLATAKDSHHFRTLPEPSAKTGADGRFEADPEIAEPKSFEVRASRRDRRHAKLPDFAITPGATIDVGTLRFDACGRLETRAVDEEGKPVPNRWIQRRAADAKDWSSCGVTFEDGTVRVPAVLAGPIVLRVRIDENAAARSDAVETSIAPGDTRKVDLVVRGLALLSGRATAGGAPLREEWLSLHRVSDAAATRAEAFGFLRARTDADGRFAFRATEPGSYLLNRGDAGEPTRFDGESWKPNGMDMEVDSISGYSVQRGLTLGEGGGADASRPVSLRAGANRADVDFGGLALQVVVLEGVGGAPIAKAEARLFDLPAAPGGGAGSERPVRVLLQTDAQGRGTFRELQPGRYGVMAFAKERPPSDVATVEVAGAPAAAVTVTIPRAAEVSGRIVDEDGRPVSRVQIAALRGANASPTFPGSMFESREGNASTDDDGRFAFARFAPGNRRIAVFHEGHAAAAFGIVAPSKDNVFVLRRTATIRATARRDGKPVDAWMNLDTEAADAPLSEEAVDALQPELGRFQWDASGVLERTPPGAWTVIARERGKENAAPGTARVHVLPGETVEVTIDLP